MVEFLTVVYLAYIFLSLYLLSLYILIYVFNRKEFFSTPKPDRIYSLDMIIPCHNESSTIGKTISTVLESDYPGLKKVIVVDDCSTDNSFEIIKEIAKKNKKVIAVQTPQNTGKASGSKNYGTKFATSELLGFIDGDSFPEKSAISKMVGFFNDNETGAVTSVVLVSNQNELIEKFQAIEYRIISFTRKLLGFVDGIYVTPGALAIYKKEAFEAIGRFDEKNMTEDIEITWNLASKGYKVRMSSLSYVNTIAPSKFKDWMKQRIRWNVGGLQTIGKYKSSFLKSGMLGQFILPFFVISWLVGLSGLGIMFYRIIQGIIINSLALSYSVTAQTAVVNLNSINLIPSILFFFGSILMVSGLAFTLIALNKTKGKEFKRVGAINLLGYIFIYLLIYPIILIISAYRAARGKYSW